MQSLGKKANGMGDLLGELARQSSQWQMQIARGESFAFQETAEHGHEPVRACSSRVVGEVMMVVFCLLKDCKTICQAVLRDDKA